jgi:hypothetical protein
MRAVRIVTVMLLLVNICFFGWSYWQGAQADELPASASAPVAPLQLATVRSAAATHCQSLGPFTDSAQMLSVSAVLTARGLGSLVRQVERKVPDGTWVYIDGLKSIAERGRVVQKLRRAGIHDVAEMPEADYSERVSAGIFLDPKGAEQRAAQVRAAGFEPKVEERQRTVAERWLNVEWSVGATPATPTELGASESAQAAIGWVDCPAAASSG